MGQSDSRQKIEGPPIICWIDLHLYRREPSDPTEDLLKLGSERGLQVLGVLRFHVHSDSMFTSAVNMVFK
jgi:hypothetical protein